MVYNSIPPGSINRPRPIVSAPMPNRGNLPAGIQTGREGVTRAVQNNELTSKNMEILGDANNRILNQARKRGVAAAASRGGINSNLAAAGGESAYLDMAGQVASQDAAAYRDAAGQNLESLKQQRISSEGNATQLGAANISAGASMYNADLDLQSAREGRLQDRDLTLSGRLFQTGEREGDQRFRSGEREGDQRFRSEESQRDRDFTTGRDRTLFDQDQRGRDADMDRNVALELMQRFIDNPEEYDEYMTTGALEFFNQFMRPTRP